MLVFIVQLILAEIEISKKLKYLRSQFGEELKKMKVWLQ